MGIGVVLFEQIGTDTLVPCHDQGIHTQELTQQMTGLQGRDAKRFTQQSAVDAPLFFAHLKNQIDATLNEIYRGVCKIASSLR